MAPNPVGYDRVYVHLDEEFSYDQWFEGLRAGRVMVTNGPLIRPNVEGEMPGHVFQADAGQEVDLEVGLTLSTRDKISYLEVDQERPRGPAKCGSTIGPRRAASCRRWFSTRAAGS